MRVPAVLLSIAFALVGVTFPANALRTYTGNNCNGDSGPYLACDSACHGYAGQHSLKVNKMVIGTLPQLFNHLQIFPKLCRMTAHTPTVWRTSATTIVTVSSARSKLLQMVNASATTRGRPGPSNVLSVHAEWVNWSWHEHRNFSRVPVIHNFSFQSLRGRKKKW